MHVEAGDECWMRAGATFPIACVDWCDAFAYCAWAGKRLCGAVPDGGALDYALAGDRTASDFRNALSGIARCDNADFDSRSFNSVGVGIRCCANSR